MSAAQARSASQPGLTRWRGRACAADQLRDVAGGGGAAPLLRAGLLHE